MCLISISLTMTRVITANPPMEIMGKNTRVLQGLKKIIIIVKRDRAFKNQNFRKNENVRNAFYFSFSFFFFWFVSTFIVLF